MQIFRPTRFRENQDGAAAVEFALILPILLTIYIGVVNAFDAYRASRLMSRATVVMADQVTRLTAGQQMTDQRMAFYENVVQTIMGPYADARDFNITVTGINNPFGPPNDPRLVWTLASNPSKRVCQDDLEKYDLPQIPAADSVILVTISGTYSPLPINFYPDAFEWADYQLEDFQVRRPRFQDEVEYDGTSEC